MSRPLSGDSVFGALSHETRRRMVISLRNGETAAGQILPKGVVSPAVLSSHLRIMRECGLISARAEGRRIMYRLNPAALAPVRDFLARAGGIGSKR